MAGALLTGVEVLVLGAGVPAAAFSLYLLVLSIAALRHRGADFPGAPTARLLVVVPAHDEAALVGRCVRSLLAQTYPRELYEVAVVADNCSDETAALARAAGADTVLVREEPHARGKGRALRFAFDRLLSRDPAPDAVVVVDADSVADPGFLAALAQPLGAGARAAQGESLLAPAPSAGSQLRALAFLLVNRARPAGRTALGLSATHLAGNGMLLTRELLLERPWGAFTSAEDLEYSLDLRADGIPIAFARGAVLRSPAAPDARSAAEQQLRWEGGKAYLARTRLPRLVARALRERRPHLVGLAFDLAVPPLGYLALGSLAGALLTLAAVLAGAAPAALLAPWLVALAALPPMVAIGLRAAGAPRDAWRLLWHVPAFLAAKAVRAGRVAGFRGQSWVRTPRGPHAELDGPAS